VEESLLKFLCVNAISDKVVRQLSMQKWFTGDIQYYMKISLKVTHPLKNLKTPISNQYSLVVPKHLAKSSINTDRKSMSYPISLR